MKCNECGSSNFVKYGTKRYRTGKHQVYQCTQCGATKKGDVVQQLPKGKTIPVEIIEPKAEPKKRPEIKNMMHKV